MNQKAFPFVGDAFFEIAFIALSTAFFNIVKIDK
jgi:hypothetical protein